MLLRWGDPLFPDSPAFNPTAQSAAAQLKQFGYNNDYVAFFPLDDSGKRGLLCVNHEYTNEEVMFPGISKRQDTSGFEDMTAELVDIEMAAHGVSIVEIAREGEDWRVVLDSTYNRRISPGNTEMTVDGPAAGDERLKTSADPTAKTILGTLNNCAGGKTPWGTYLTAEENFHGYFWSNHCVPGGARAQGARRRSGQELRPLRHSRASGRPGANSTTASMSTRSRTSRTASAGSSRSIRSIASSVPVKHTAFGRFCHEGAECVVNKDGRVVVYCGDDGRGEYVYRFVSDGRYDPDNRAANMTLLSNGTLSVARFDADGKVTWLPLVFGRQWLTPDFGFKSQADVVIDARLAADLLGATRMDRPEDVQPNDGQRPRLCHPDQQHQAQAGRGERSEPARRQRLRPHHRDDAAGRRPCRRCVRLGDAGSLRRPRGRRGRRAVEPATRRAMAGSPAPTTPRSTLRGGCGSRPTRATTGRAPAASDGLYALETDGERRADVEALLPLPRRRRAVRPLLHA